MAESKSPNNYAKDFIADSAKNCGDLKYGGDPSKIKTCIFEKITNVENFYTWFWFKSGSTNPATGLILKDGILYITWYDKIGKGKETYFQNHLCDKWDLNPDAAKPIICYMKKPKAAVHLFELTSIIEIKII